MLEREMELEWVWIFFLKWNLENICRPSDVIGKVFLSLDACHRKKTRGPKNLDGKNCYIWGAAVASASGSSRCWLQSLHFFRMRMWNQTVTMWMVPPCLPYCKIIIKKMLQLDRSINSDVVQCSVIRQTIRMPDLNQIQTVGAAFSMLSFVVVIFFFNQAAKPIQ